MSLPTSSEEKKLFSNIQIDISISTVLLINKNYFLKGLNEQVQTTEIGKKQFQCFQ